MMENLIKNPGLQHIALNIFCNLDLKMLKICKQMNQFSNQLLDLENPYFWLQKFIQRGLPKKQQRDWTKAIQLTKGTVLAKYLCAYLKKCTENERVVNLPCYINEEFLQNSYGMIKKYLNNASANTATFMGNTPLHIAAGDNDLEAVKVLALVAENTNAQNFHGGTPIHRAVSHNNVDIVKILASVTDNPNAPDASGQTPIHWAAYAGSTEILKILVPLTDNPNTQSNSGATPIGNAALRGHTEALKILVPLTSKPNAPHNYYFGRTPIHFAAVGGHTEALKILAPLTDDPNAPDKFGTTPIKLAKDKGHTECVRILESFKN